MGSRKTWWCGLVLALCVGALSSCGPSTSDGGIDVAGPDLAPTPQAQGLERSLDGIWSTGVSRGGAREVIYAIEWQPSTGLRIMRDDVRLDGAVEDIDEDKQTLAFRVARDTGPDETVTLRKVRDAGDGVALRMTWARGQTDALRFVRRLTDRDRQEIGLAIGQAATADLLATSCDSNAPDRSLRATLACRQDEFAALDRGLRTQLIELAARYPDGDRTAADVVQQLDACDSKACLRQVYAQWQAYFDENYDLGDVLDYH